MSDPMFEALQSIRRRRKDIQALRQILVDEEAELATAEIAVMRLLHSPASPAPPNASPSASRPEARSNVR